MGPSPGQQVRLGLRCVTQALCLPPHTHKHTGLPHETATRECRGQHGQHSDPQPQSEVQAPDLGLPGQPWRALCSQFPKPSQTSS